MSGPPLATYLRDLVYLCHLRSLHPSDLGNASQKRMDLGIFGNLGF